MQKCNNFLGILQFHPMGIELFSLKKPFHHSPCPIMGTLTMAITKKTLNHSTTYNHVRILWHKIPRVISFKLRCTTIIPHIMPLWCIPMFHHMLPMKVETMLNKLWIMLLVIKNVKVVLNENPWFLSYGFGVRLWWKHICIKIEI